MTFRAQRDKAAVRVTRWGSNGEDSERTVTVERVERDMQGMNMSGQQQ